MFCLYRPKIFNFLPENHYNIIVRRFGLRLVSSQTHSSWLEGDMGLNFVPFCSSEDAIFNKDRVPLNLKFLFLFLAYT